MRFKSLGKYGLLLFTMALAVFASMTFAPHVQTEYYPEWGNAAWIRPPHPTAVAYYRRILVLEDTPVKAHIQIAAPDIYYLYVNGTQIANQVMLSTWTSAITDIGPFLVAGKNVIAIQVDRKTDPGLPEIIVNGSWQDRAGRIHRFVSDSFWRVTTEEEWQYTNSNSVTQSNPGSANPPMASGAMQQTCISQQSSGGSSQQSGGGSGGGGSSTISNVGIGNSASIGTAQQACVTDTGQEQGNTSAVQQYSGIATQPDGLNTQATATWSYWYGYGFIDTGWTHAVADDRPAVQRPMQYLDTPPRLFDDFPRGQWIWTTNRASYKATFRREFELPAGRIREAWIGISSANAAYELTVNDFLLANANNTNAYMDTYDIGRFLKPGKNTVIIDAAAGVPNQMAAFSLTADVDGKQLDFSSDGRWQSTVAGAESRWGPVAVINTMGIMPVAALNGVSSGLTYPAVQIASASPPPVWWLQKALDCVVWFIGLLGVNVLLSWLVPRFLQREAGPEASFWPHWVWPHWVYPSAVGSVLLGFLFMLEFDVRVTPIEIFQPLTFLAVWALTALWAIAAMLSGRRSLVAAGGAG